MPSKRIRDKNYLGVVRGKPCLACGVWQSVVAHHLMYAEPSAMGLRSGDNWAVPLCTPCHMDLHRHGDEKLWWAYVGVDPLPWAKENWSEWDNLK